MEEHILELFFLPFLKYNSFSNFQVYSANFVIFINLHKLITQICGCSSCFLPPPLCVKIEELFFVQCPREKVGGGGGGGGKRERERGERERGERERERTLQQLHFRN